MNVNCLDCGKRYDDARHLTFCPHDPLMSDADLKQKDAGLALLGKVVRFNHEPDGPTHRVQWVGYNGMVGIDTYRGDFAPHLFVVVEA